MMCGHSASIEATKWQREKPDSEGEWLWVIQWGCGCVLASGIASVWNADYRPEDEQFNRLTNLGADLWLSWEGSMCKFDSPRPLNEITAWQKIEMPPLEWSDDR